MPLTRSGWKEYERSAGRRIGAPRIPVTGRQGPGGDPGDLAIEGFYTEVRDQKRPRPLRWMREVWEEARLHKRKPLLIFKGPAPHLSPLVLLRWADFAEVYNRARPDRGARPDAGGPGAAVPGTATGAGS